METTGPGGDRPTPARGAGWLRRGGLDLGVLLLLCFQAWTTSTPLMTGSLCIHVDSVGHWGRAIDCADGRGCSLSLGRRSRLNLAHGAVFTHLEAGLAAAGGTLFDLAALVALFYALALFLLYRIGSLLLGRAPGLLAAEATLAAAALPMGTGLSILWNPSLLPLPTVLFLGACALLARSGQTRFLVLAALFLSLTAQTHLAGLTLAPVLLGTIGMLPRKQWAPAVILVVGVGTLALLLVSPASLTQMALEPLRGLAAGAEPVRGAWLFLVGLSLLATLETGWRWRASRRRGERDWRLDFLLGVGLSHLPLLLLAVTLAGSSSHYLLPLVPGLALVIAAALDDAIVHRCRPWGSPCLRRGVVLGLVAVLGIRTTLQAIHTHGEPPAPDAAASLSCVEPHALDVLARFMEADLRWSFEEVLWRLRGVARPEAWRGGLAAVLADPAGPGKVVDAELALLPLPAANRAAVPPGWIDLAPGAPPARDTIGAYLYRSVLRWSETEFCAAAAEGEERGALGCRPLLDRPEASLPAAAAPAPHAIREMTRITVPRLVWQMPLRFRVPLRRSSPGPGPRTRLLLPTPEPEGCDHRFVAAQGVAFESISDTEAILGPASGEGPAYLLFETGRNGCPSWLFDLPQVLEWPADLPAEQARHLWGAQGEDAPAGRLPLMALAPGRGPDDWPRVARRGGPPPPDPGASLPYRTPLGYVVGLLLLLGGAVLWTSVALYRPTHSR